MKITWAGHSCFAVSTASLKEAAAELIIDPFSENIGLKLPSFRGDIVLVTHQHDDHNNVSDIKGDPFVIAGPGEFEIKGVFIQGIDSFHDDKQGSERGKNTIYIIESEEMRLCHLGDLGQSQLSDEQLEKIGSVDILMIPVGGVFTISHSQAQKIIGQIEPKIVIPMHYALPKLAVKLDPVDLFLKSMGKDAPVAQDKLAIKATALPKEKNMEIIVLKP